MTLSAELLVAGASSAFFASHVGVALVRRPLVARLGDVGFLVAFSVVAEVFFAVAVVTYATHRFEGAAGPDLGRFDAVRLVLVVCVAFGFALMTAALTPKQYFRSPQALFNTRTRDPYGLERITRHPFFAGLVLAFTAHALLATRLVGTIFFGGLVLLAVVGSMHQDKKLVAQKGHGYARFLEQTSAVPFVAILRGRQRFAWREQPWLFLVLGLVVAWLLRTFHDRVFANDGSWFVLAVDGPTTCFVVLALWRRRRSAQGLKQTPPAPGRS
jgi:uncharacterized membrane protein